VSTTQIASRSKQNAASGTQRFCVAGSDPNCMVTLKPRLNMKTPRSVLSVLLFLGSAAVVCAHPGHGPHFGASAGFLHPLTGWDHALAMIAVGFWAAQLGAPWLLSGTFIATMSVGALVGHWAGPVSGVEQGIAASVLALGLLIGSAISVRIAWGVALVGLFALFHGLAHGAEMPATAGALEYGLGFIAATALLHLAGIGISSVAAGRFSLATRLAGAAVAVAGVILLTR